MTRSPGEPSRLGPHCSLSKLLRWAATSGAIAACAAAGCGPPPRRGPQIQRVDGRDVRDVYKDAVNAFKNGDYPAAYHGFAGVWSVEKKPKVAGNLGRTELKLKKYCDGVAHLTVFLEEQKDLAQEDRADVERLRARARWSTTALQLTVRPDGAEIFVDDVPAGKAPIGRDLCLDPGKHKIEARLGERRASADVFAAPGGKVAKKLEVAAKAE